MTIRSKSLVLALSVLVPTLPFAGYVLAPTVTGELALRALAAANLGLPPVVPTTTEPRGDAPTVLVEVQGLRSNRGHVLGALFDSAASWGIEGRQIAVCRARIVGRRAFCAIEVAGAGHYGFAFMHDENDNDRMDTNFLGLPDEGFGFSNDAPVSFGPPSFEAVRFRHDGALTSMVLQVRYGI